LEQAYNNRITLGWQFSCAPLPAGYAGRSLRGGRQKRVGFRSGTIAVMAGRGFEAIRPCKLARRGLRKVGTRLSRGLVSGS